MSQFPIRHSLSSNPEAWPAQGKVFPVSSLELLVDAAPHPFHLAERERIAANWHAETAANPALFDGEMILQRDIHIEAGRIRGVGHLVPYSAFLWWRKQRLPRPGFHLFGFAVPVSSDGAIIAVRMSAHTANPGKVYCAAGSLDASDIVSGRCDLDANMARELREETGLDLSAARAEEDLFAFHLGQKITVFRFFHFAETADRLIARIGEHMIEDEEQEIDAAFAIGSADPASHDYSPAMLPILDHFFSRLVFSRFG
jgi:8-oxo-dGTP pyrophosphatase MutT (NUDIX family)